MTPLSLDLVSLIVDDYDTALDFFTDALGFVVAEDPPSTTAGVDDASSQCANLYTAYTGEKLDRSQYVLDQLEPEPGSLSQRLTAWPRRPTRGPPPARWADEASVGHGAPGSG